MKRKVNIKVSGSLVVVVRNGVEYDVSDTNTWMYDLEDELNLSDGVHECYIESALYRDMMDTSKRLLTEFPSIQNIDREGIIGQPTGCRVNGGGTNRCLITTALNTYIVGSREILKRLPDGTWNSEELTSDEDIEFCNKLDKSESYEYCSGKFFHVVGCSMPQIAITINK